jgi:hypothetical protein
MPNPSAGHQITKDFTPPSQTSHRKLHTPQTNFPVLRSQSPPTRGTRGRCPPPSASPGRWGRAGCGRGRPTPRRGGGRRSAAGGGGWGLGLGWFLVSFAGCVIGRFLQGGNMQVQTRHRAQQQTHPPPFHTQRNPRTSLQRSVMSFEMALAFDGATYSSLRNMASEATQRRAKRSDMALRALGGGSGVVGCGEGVDCVQRVPGEGLHILPAKPPPLS